MLKDAAVSGRNSRPSRAHLGHWSLGRQGTLSLVLAVLLFLPGFSYWDYASKIKTKLPPEYPELVRKSNIIGMALFQVTIAPDGDVRDVKELGGNPVLVEALVRAVKKWRYESTDRISSVEVKFDFSPQ